LEDKKRRMLSDLAASGADAAVVIADSELSSPIGSTAECVELFSDTANIFVIGGISPLIEYETQLRQFDGLLSRKRIIAVKLYPGHEAYFMDDPRLEKTFELCERHDVPLAVHTGWDNVRYNHPDYFRQIAKAQPELRIVICHLFWPDIDLCYSATADCENIYYDISSLAHDTTQIEKTSDFLAHMSRQCPDRIVFGSDYGACSITAHINMVKSLAVSEDQKQGILCMNAIKLYRLP
jgi:predicted TIM-barrel fold metal-dependent hydrolase